MKPDSNEHDTKPPSPSEESYVVLPPSAFQLTPESVTPASLMDCVREGTLSIPRELRQQKAFLKFVRRASLDRRFLHQVQQFRDALLLSTVRPGPKEGGLTIGLTGVSGGEGASILALLLSLSLGDCSQRRVAFLDIRFNFDRFAALSDMLELSQNSVRIPKGFDQVSGYYNERCPNIYFLRGSGAETGMHFLSDKRLGEFLGALRQNFDFTVMDLPPLVTETAGVFVLPNIDRLYLVAEAGRTRLSQVQRALDVAHDGGCQIHGVVLNKQTAPWWSRLFWRDFFF